VPARNSLVSIRPVRRLGEGKESRRAGRNSGARAMTNSSQQPPSPEDQKWAYERQNEERRWQHEMKLRAAERTHDSLSDYVSKVNQSAIEAGNLTLRALGGAGEISL
jgi:hypothetical protein